MVAQLSTTPFAIRAPSGHSSCLPYSGRCCDLCPIRVIIGFVTASKPFDKERSWIDDIREQYEKNGRRKITLYIVDHGNETGGQQIDDVMLKHYKSRWKELGQYVDTVVLMGCKVGKKGQECAEFSDQINGTVWANTGKIRYGSVGSVRPPFSDPSWKKWRDGKLVTSNHGAKENKE